MKKLIRLLILITTSQVSFCQSKIYSLLDGKTIVSSIYQEPTILNTEPTTVVNEKTNTTTITTYAKGNVKRRFVVTRNMAFKANENSSIIKFKIQRIQQTNNRINIDTNMPFGSDEVSKVALDNFLPVVKKNVDVKLHTTNNFTKTDLEIIELSQAELPSLNSQSVLSGVLISENNIDKKDWTDSIKVVDGYYINNYKLVEEGKLLFKLEGYFVPNKRTPKSPSEEVDYSLLKEGQSIEAETEILEMKYSGTVTMFEKYPNVIQNIELENYSSIIMTIMGDPLPEKAKTNFRVINKFID